MMVIDGGALDSMLHGTASAPRTFLSRFGYNSPPIGAIAAVRPIDVEVNHGIWIWRCPCDLGSERDLPKGGGVAFVDEPIGWCPRCLNADCGGLWRPLRFPDERQAIEAVLGLRPDRETRNWWAGETVADLERENAENGVGGASL